MDHSFWEMDDSLAIVETPENVKGGGTSGG
jgi:hypothetical protein